jgi:hypothetical protein
MVERAGIFDAQRPGHKPRLARRKIKCQDSRPDPGDTGLDCCPMG